MLDMNLPPYDADAALRMGDNSRAVEIQQVAKELSEAKLSYLKMATQGEICQRLKVLHVAFVSGMGDAEFRVLWGYLMHGNRDGKGITLGQKRLGLLIDKSERAVRRATKDLEDGGWLDVAKRQRKDASRSAVIPERMMNAILFEIVERSNSSGQRIEVPRLSSAQSLDRTNTPDRTEVAAQEVTNPASQVALTGQKRDFRPEDSGNITIIDNHRVLVVAPEREAEQLGDVEFAQYNELFNSWGVKPAQREMNHKAGFDKPRRITDLTLAGAVRAQIKLGHDPRIAVAAAQMTISSMLARVALQEDQRGAPGGIQSYFQKEFLGNIELLERPASEVTAPVARAGPPGREAWQERKDAEYEKSKKLTEALRRVSQQGKLP